MVRFTHDEKCGLIVAEAGDLLQPICGGYVLSKVSLGRADTGYESNKNIDRRNRSFLAAVYMDCQWRTEADGQNRRLESCNKRNTPTSKCFQGSKVIQYSSWC